MMTTLTDRSFEKPPFSRGIRLADYLAHCPRTSTTRGIFFAYVHDLALEKIGDDARLYQGLDARRWLPFKNYSLADFMRLAYNAARLVYPREPVGEGLRRIGWMSFPAFAATMAGRVVLFAFGQTLEDIVLATPKSYALTLPGAGVEVRRVADKRFLFTMRNVPSFVTTYHVGVIEGAIRASGREPFVTVRTCPRNCDADFFVHWR